MADAHGYADQIGEGFAGLAALAGAERHMPAHVDACAALLDLLPDASYGAGRVADGLEDAGFVHPEWVSMWREVRTQLAWLADLAEDLNARLWVRR